MQADGTDFDGLVAQVLAGNREAFRGIVDGCEAKVRLVLAAMLHEASNVEDVAQETFVIAYQKLAEYQIGTNFPAWIKAIARNLALNERRAWQRRQAASKKYEGFQLIEERLDNAVDVLGAFMSDEVMDSLHICIEALAPHARDMVKARYVADTPIEMIARRSSRQIGNIRLTLHRARLALADCLRRQGVLSHV